MFDTSTEIDFTEIRRGKGPHRSLIAQNHIVLCRIYYELWKKLINANDRYLYIVSILDLVTIFTSL